MTVDLWNGEDVIITMEEEGADEVYSIQGRCTSYKISGGENTIETLRTFGKVDLVYEKGIEKFRVDLEVLPTNQLFSYPQLGSTVTSKEISTLGTAKRWRIVVWFVPYADQRRNTLDTDVVVPKYAASATAGGEALRHVWVDARGVSFDREIMSDGHYKLTVGFEIPAYTPDGTAGWIEGYTASGTYLGALTTTTHQGTLTWTTTAGSTVAWTGSYRTA